MTDNGQSMLSAGAYSFRQKSRLAISLSWVAGYTNVIALVMLGGVVVAHVTGNVTHFGRSAAEVVGGSDGAWRGVAFFGFVVAAFAGGAVASAVMTELARRRGARSKYVLPIAVEALLFVALGVGTWLHLSGRISVGEPVHHYWMTGVAAAAMGLQNATITRVSGAVVRTTHLTGVVTDLGLEGVQYALWVFDRTAGRRRSSGRIGRTWAASRRQPSFQRLLLLSSIFGSFLFGAFAGTLAFARFPSVALAVPVAFLLWIVWVDLRKPIADVRELDPTADPDLGGVEAVREVLPPGVGLYRLTHVGKVARHHAPDFGAWLDRLPHHWRVVVLVVSPLTHFDEDSAADLSAVVRRMRADGRDLILCGVKPVQYKALRRGGLFAALGRANVAPDLEMAVARAMNLVGQPEESATESTEAQRPGRPLNGPTPAKH